MAQTVAPDSVKEQEHIDSEVRAHYRPIPLWLSRAVLSLAGVIGFIVVVNNVGLPEGTYGIAANIGAIILGLLLGLFLARATPSFNKRWLEKISADSRAEYARRLGQFNQDLQALSTDVAQFRGTVGKKSYQKYAKAASFIQSQLSKLRAGWQFLCNTLPEPLSQLETAFDGLIREIEADEAAVLVYEPACLQELDCVKARVNHRNAADCYRASKQLDYTLSRLESRTVPFDFTQTTGNLRSQWQACRDQILSDPTLQATWLKVQRDDEELEEIRRHNEIMEAAEESRAEEARKQTDLMREHNRLAKETRNATRAAAVAGAGAVYYARKGAKATTQLAKKSGAKAESRLTKS